jgi:DNA-binding winged helix-turn-helix (wHTH) protein
VNRVFRFASFDADRERYQLRHEHRAIKLERIPLDLLFLLLENSGRLVLREQIVARLWCDESFLDTERSINTAVRKLRRALEDDAHHPRFIETVVGKGYRFVGPMLPEAAERLGQIDLNPVPASHADNHDSVEIRLRGFSVEISGRMPVLTCEVMVDDAPLGRLPVLELQLPAAVTFPLKPPDRLLLALHGLRVTLTDKALQGLNAFSIAALQSGMRTRATDYPLTNLESCAPMNAATGERESGEA